ncbi:MAG TPA: hypothetical protein VET88_02375 [Gammaproteobacteria bacterium]|nr:hypothetical protein [Gammaproteobacteria bacterium]
MGLATVHDIVTGMDGTIDVESAPGKGTIFTVSLPAVTAAVQAEPEVLPPVDMTVEGCVVIVDGEPLVREASARALAAADAARALAIIEELGDRVAILVTDVVMPGVGARTRDPCITAHSRAACALYHRLHRRCGTAAWRGDRARGVAAQALFASASDRSY